MTVDQSCESTGNAQKPRMGLAWYLGMGARKEERKWARKLPGPESKGLRQAEEGAVVGDPRRMSGVEADVRPPRRLSFWFPLKAGSCAVIPEGVVIQD